MKTLLLCGYRPLDTSERALGIERDELGQTLIDRRIQQLRNLGQEVVCVLAGPEAEIQLREGRAIQDAELIFDTNTPSLLANLKAGLQALIGEACFVLPVEVPLPPDEVWQSLRYEFLRLGTQAKEHMLQAVTAEGAPCQLGFPLLVTISGVKLLQNSTNLTHLLDPQLKYRHVLQSDVAPMQFTL
jgi:hypothetical protein